jgi:hypothetical protein
MADWREELSIEQRSQLSRADYVPALRGGPMITSCTEIANEFSGEFTPAKCTMTEMFAVMAADIFEALHLLDKPTTSMGITWAVIEKPKTDGLLADGRVRIKVVYGIEAEAR